MGRAIGQTNDSCVKRDIVFNLYFSECEKKKLEKMAYLQGISMNEFVREALNEKYKKMLDEEVRQYEHSRVHSEIHKGSRKPDSDDSERTGTDRDCGSDGKTGTEG
jgi:hypothetical protein